MGTLSPLSPAPPRLADETKPPWRPKDAGINGAVLGPLAGAFVAHSNLKRLGNPRKATLVLWGSIAACFPLIGLFIVLPGDFGRFVAIPLAAFNMWFYKMIQEEDFEKWESAQSQAPSQGGTASLGGSKSELRLSGHWSSVLRGLLGAVVFIAIAMVVAVILGPFIKD